MSKFRIYKSNSDKLGALIKSILKKHGEKILTKTLEKNWGIITKDIGGIPKGDSFVVGYSCGMAANTIDTNTKRVLIVEKLARDRGNVTMFIDDADFINALIRSKINVDKSVLINQGPEPFFVSATCGIHVDGVEISPFVFMVDGGMFPGLVSGSSTLHNVGYVMGVEDREDPKTENLYSCFSYEDLETCFRDRPKSKFDNICRVHAKLGYSLYCYMKAFPECIIPGAPSSVSAKELFHGGIKNKITGFRLKAPIDSNTGVALHLRRGHFRSLHDKKFKKNDDGTTKIIWVRDSVVGGKLDPYTVQSVLN